MELSADLLKRFVQATNDKEPKKKETTVYGTVVKNGESTYVKLDGSSNTLTPAFLGVCADNNDRVIVNIKNHSATITNNLTSPPKTGIYSEILNENFNIITGRIASIEMITSKAITTDTLSAALVDAGYISAEEIHSEYIRADELVSKIANIDTLTANDAFIRNIQTVALNADYIKSAVADVGYLTADSAVITNLQTDKLNARELNSEVAKLGYLTANSAVITSLQTDKLNAKDLNAEVAKLGYLDAKMANIDFANLNKANIGQLFANVGLISSATITDGHVTGYLDSVEVNANKITAGTLAVDRLLIKDSSGNYKMATYDSSGNLVTTTVNGSVITNRTITADHLVAGTITANEINMTNLVGNSAFVNAINTNSIVVSASNNASSALSTANTANTNASNALNTANSANTTANSASSTANSALSTANTANSNASSAISTANSANTKAQGIIDNIYTPNTTTINGGKITTGSIKASQIDVNDLFAQNITASGTITGATLKGSYVECNSFYAHHGDISTKNYISININDYETWNDTKYNAFKIDHYSNDGKILKNFRIDHNTICMASMVYNNDTKAYYGKSSVICSDAGEVQLNGEDNINLSSEEIYFNGKSFFNGDVALYGSLYENGTALSNKYAPISHTHSYIESKGNYTFDSSTLPTSFDYGISAGFVNSDSGFGSFGSVLTVRTYNFGGGTLQLYAPYSPTYGGTHLKARFGNYDSNTGNSWTNLNEIAWVSDIPTNNNQLTNGAGYITSSGSCNYATSAGNADTVDGKHFNWSGQSGQPTWLWGGEDGTNMYVYNPSNFSVSHSRTMQGSYTYNGGQQKPNYFGVNKVGALMMNTPINGNSHYKDFLIMDCYNGNDVGGATAIGVDRQEMRAFIMGSDAVRTSWSRSAELITTSNIGSQSVNYANSAGSAPASDVYSWAKQSTKPSYALNEITGSSDIFKVVTYSYNSVSVASGSSATVTPSRTNIPSGYTAVAVYTVNSGGGRIYPRAHSADGTIVLVNESSKATVTPSMKVLCVKSNCVG